MDNSLQIHASGRTNFDSGNVGIGVADPDSRLHVNGTVHATGFRLGNSATTGYVLTTNSNGVGTWQASTGGGDFTLPVDETVDLDDQTALSITNTGTGESTRAIKAAITNAGTNGYCNAPDEDRCTCEPDCGTPDPEETGSSCFDGIDNDCDGLTDCDDVDCACPAVVPPGVPADAVHAAAKHHQISIDPSTNSGGGRDVAALTVGYRIELTEMQRCALDLARACTVTNDCDNGATGPCGPHPDVGGVWWVQVHRDEPLGCLPKRCLAWDGGPCNSDDDSGGAPGSCDNHCGPTDQFARVDAAPFFSDWTDPRFTLDLLHIMDCEITPVASYEIRACLPPGVLCSDPLPASTTLQSWLAPGYRGNYGDAVGPVDPLGVHFPNFEAPNGYTNVVDLSGYLLTKQNYGTANVPQAHPTWVDLHGLGDLPPPNGNPPNYIINVADMALIKKALVGGQWTDDPGNLTPGQCP